MRYRYENFGGIISLDDPPLLAFVDREYMRELGLPESGLWNTDDESVGILSAPAEVHFALTNKCSGNCPHCYMNSGSRDKNELDENSVKKALDILAEMKIFHVAMGGGDALEREDLFETAEYARKIGIVPNLTISGNGINRETASKMKLFGQVNVSMDGVGRYYYTFRNKGAFETADAAVDLLIDAGVPCGLNCVVGRRNFSGIESLFQYAKQKGINEIEFLRLKPSGRGRKLFLEEKTAYDQNIALIPLLEKASAATGITAKIDCSFIPMLCRHYPSLECLYALASFGCEAANVLIGVNSRGMVSGCSFLSGPGISIFDLPAAVNEHDYFDALRTSKYRKKEPCASCRYLDICKGGCRAVSEYIFGDGDMPDPDCPFVVEFNGKL